MLSIGALFFSEMKENLAEVTGDVKEIKTCVQKLDENVEKLLQKGEENKVSRNFSLFVDFSMLRLISTMRIDQQFHRKFAEKYIWACAVKPL